MDRCPICCELADEFDDCQCGYMKIATSNQYYQEAKKIVTREKKKIKHEVGNRR